MRLYDRYRPRRFRDVVGQDDAVKVLRNATRRGQLAGRTFLIYGPSGTGKTTLAHILTKAANCERLKTGEPCGECDGCLNAEPLEFPAIEGRGIGDIRRLARNLGFSPPLRGGTRFVLVDEAHTFTGDAREALLPVIEKLSAINVLVLTTTKPDFDEAFLSRCQQVKLKKVSQADAVEYLVHILQSERKANRLSTPGETKGAWSRRKVLTPIVSGTDGNLRLAAQRLEQVINALPDDYAKADVRRAVKALPKPVRPKTKKTSPKKTTPRKRYTPHQRQQAILGWLLDGEWHLWSEVQRELRRYGMKDTLRKTRDALEKDGDIEVQHKGRPNLQIREILRLND